MNLLRVVGILGLLGMAGCGTISGWSNTHPADVSRLFLGTRVDACWMAKPVPDPLKPAQWGLRLPSEDPEKPATADCWFCMDVPFSVAADLLLLPVALVLPLFRDRTAEQLSEQLEAKLLAAETISFRFSGKGLHVVRQDHPITIQGRVCLKSGNRALYEGTTDFYGTEWAFRLVSDGKTVVIQWGNKIENMVVANQPTSPTLNENLIRLFVRAGPCSHHHVERAATAKWYSKSIWQGGSSYVVDHGEEQGSETVTFQILAGISETGTLRIDPSSGLLGSRTVEVSGGFDQEKYGLLNYVETITAFELNKNISDKTFKLPEDKK